ncbi:hypothetical protein IL306_010482 [Fusarium sp. DS 682]|nr:hypothetical protein IL306_010482 [Fusarium sp. DS 682]
MNELEEMGGDRLSVRTQSTSENGTATRFTTADADHATPVEQNDTHSSHGAAAPSVQEVAEGAPRAKRTRPKVDNVTVKRKLRGVHLFMITINGTLGTGLYMQSGQIVELGGPVAVISSFLVLGLLAWAVMQCMTELLCLWPVPGALPLFVRRFVDQELGIAVGVAYWFTYSVGFAALTASAASILSYWTHGFPPVTIVVVYVALPMILVFINMLKIGLYGLFEVVTGALKITFLLIVLLTLIVVYGRRGISKETKSSWEGSSDYDEQAATGYFSALMMCFSIATFAYTGVEIIAASAIEARWPSSTSVTDDQAQQDSTSTERPTNNQTAQVSPPTLSTQEGPDPANRAPRNWTSIKNTIKFTAGYVPIFVAVAYTFSGLIVSLGLYRDHPELPKLSWIQEATGVETKQVETGISFSPFIVVAKASDIPGLDHVFNAFILFTCLTCANTNLYVASRTLFGMAKNVHDTHWILQWFSYFGKTNGSFVPLRAVIISAAAFCWVPLLQIPEDFGTSVSLRAYVETFAQMGSVSVVIVWTCHCLAYIRFYHW